MSFNQIFGQFCDVAKSDGGSHEDLANFGYNLNMNQKSFKISFYIFGHILHLMMSCEFIVCGCTHMSFVFKVYHKN